MNKRQILLISAAIGLSPAVLLLAPAVTGQLDPLMGYIGVLTIYWACFCAPVAWFFGRGEIAVCVRPKLQRTWIPFAALALPIIVFFGADTFSTIGSPALVVAIAIACALVNGPLEELAWRRTFRSNSGGHASFEFLGLCLFTLWHVPLYFSSNVEFDHGAIGLIGGAFFLGVIWTIMTHAGNSVGWPMISHTLVNIAAFLPFFKANFG